MGEGVVCCFCLGDLACLAAGLWLGSFWALGLGLNVLAWAYKKDFFSWLTSHSPRKSSRDYVSMRAASKDISCRSRSTACIAAVCKPLDIYFEGAEPLLNRSRRLTGSTYSKFRVLAPNSLIFRKTARRADISLLHM